MRQAGVFWGECWMGTAGALVRRCTATRGMGLGSPLHSRPIRTSRQLYLMWIRPSMSRCVSSW